VIAGKWGAQHVGTVIWRALEYGLTVAARNVDHFRRAQAPVVSPFEPA
jgi:hypothetical protein